MGLSNFLDAMQNIFILFSNATIKNKDAITNAICIKENADKYHVTSWCGIH